MSSTVKSIEEALRLIKEGTAVFKDTKDVLLPVASEIEKRVKERGQKREVTKHVIDMVKMVSKNIGEMSVAITNLGYLAEMAGCILNRDDARDVESDISAAKSNLDQIKRTLERTAASVGSQFLELNACLMSVYNEYDDLVVRFEGLPTPTAKNPRVSRHLKRRLDFLGLEIKGAIEELQGIESKLRL